MNADATWSTENLFGLSRADFSIKLLRAAADAGGEVLRFTTQYGDCYRFGAYTSDPQDRRLSARIEGAVENLHASAFLRTISPRLSRLTDEGYRLLDDPARIDAWSQSTKTEREPPHASRQPGTEPWLVHLINVIPRIRTGLQLTGLVVLIAALTVWQARASAVAAQVALGAVGVALLVLGQAFQYLIHIPQRQRANYILSLFVISAILVVTVLVVLLLVTSRRVEEPYHSASRRTETPPTVTVPTETFTPATVPTKTSTTITVPVPECAIRVSPSAIDRGGIALLNWSSKNAARVNIKPSVGFVVPSGQVAVSPLSTTTYTITALTAAGVSVIKQVTLRVTDDGRAAAMKSLVSHPWALHIAYLANEQDKERTIITQYDSENISFQFGETGLAEYTAWKMVDGKAQGNSSPVTLTGKNGWKRLGIRFIRDDLGASSRDTCKNTFAGRKAVFALTLDVRTQTLKGDVSVIPDDNGNPYRCAEAQPLPQ
jgi:hypothetical protein